MNARTRMPAVTRHSLEVLLHTGRPPLEATLQLAQAILRALADQHATGQAMGPFDAKSLSVDVLGHVLVKPSLDPHARAPELELGAEPDTLSDLFSLGAVLYRLLAGVTPEEATRRSGGLVPPSRFNPSVDDALDGLVLTLLDPDPMERPYRLAQVDGQLIAIGAELGLAPTSHALVTWVVQAGAPSVPPPQPPPFTAERARARPVAAPRAAPLRWADDLEADASDLDEAEWVPPVRFDVWAAASAGVVALGVLLVAMM